MLSYLFRGFYGCPVGKDWIKWHSDYDDPASALSERRRQVTELIRRSLDVMGPAGGRVLSLCCGDARDLTDALREHDRRDDVTGVVVELNPLLARAAQENLRSLDVGIEVITGDAGDLAGFQHVLPVDLLLLVGIFGNVSDSDVENTIKAVPALCLAQATVIWTRHRRPPDFTPSIRRWFDSAGCEALDFVSPGEGQFAVGRERVVRNALHREIGRRLFTFQV